MKKSLGELLCCPICRTPLEVVTLQESPGTGADESEIESGVLLSDCGFVFPIIAGVPRLLVESFHDHQDFLREHVRDFETRTAALWADYRELIEDCIERNKRTRESFAFEWNVFRYDTDTTWGFDKEARQKRFLADIGATPEQLRGQTVVDVGCGNGVLSAAIAELGAVSIAMDLSESVARAHEQAKGSGVHFVQADLQVPPFPVQSFDVVYSWGVIHHTNNTELSFSCLHELANRGGLLFVWIYQHLDNRLENMFFGLRRFTHRLPLRLQFALYFVFLLPLMYGVLAIRRSKKFNWREQMVDLLDGLSPEFRFEHGREEACCWYRKRGYDRPRITAELRYGFGLCGRKP